MKYLCRVINNVFVSKKEGLAKMTFDQAIKHRDMIRIAASKKVLAAIRQHTDMEIIGLPEEKLQQIIGNNK